MQPRPLIICGPTATGKTSIALLLAKKLNGEIISADSRQVYRGMDIGTGKDIPTGFKFQLSSLEFGNQKVGFYCKKSLKLWGYDLVNPDQEFSLSHFATFVHKTIWSIYHRGSLPIIVGGTGLYLRSIVSPPDTVNIPPDSSFRAVANSMSTVQLQQMLQDSHPDKFKQMNYSDQSNPRRLIRAIEVSKYRLKEKMSTKNEPLSNSLWLGIKQPLSSIDKKIDTRVLSRVRRGMTQETKWLMKQYPDWNHPAFSATGYKEWRQYLEGKISKPTALKLWRRREKQYARRQITWFKKQNQIHWFSFTSPSQVKTIVKQVENWYA